MRMKICLLLLTLVAWFDIFNILKNICPLASFLILFSQFWRFSFVLFTVHNKLNER